MARMVLSTKPKQITVRKAGRQAGRQAQTALIDRLGVF